jgi:hypothetical protein
MLKSTLCGVAIAAFAIAAPLRAENVSPTSASAMTTTDPGQLGEVQIREPIIRSILLRRLRAVSILRSL